MVAVKAHQAEAFLKAPDKRATCFLFFGTDAGLVNERAARLARHLAEQDNPPGEILRLDETDLDNDPDRLSVELMTMPMFGGRKIIRATSGRRVNAATIRPLLDGPPITGVLIIEAGNLKPSEGLRPLFEKSGTAAAVACYGDDARDIQSVIDEGLASAALKISPEARDVLADRLGADRALSRGEVEKLALYAAGQTEVTVADVEAVVGDASEQSMDKILTAAASGQAALAVKEYVRAIAAGDSPQAIILAAQRYLHRLHRTRGAIAQGRSQEEAIRALRPPLHFRQKETFAAQLRMWSPSNLDEALRIVAAIAKQARLNAVLEDTLAERLLLTIAKLARTRVQH